MDWVQDKIQQARTERWKHLDLGNAGLREIPHEVFDLDALESLRFAGSYFDYDRIEWVKSENQGAANQITLIPGEITRLINLRMLDLNGTQVSDLTPLQGLRTLSELAISDTQVSDLTPLQGLSMLSELGLIGTQVSDLRPLQGLSMLSRLDLSRTQVSDLTPLQGLSTLSELDLSDTQVSDLRPLQGLSMLSRLDLSHTQVSDLRPLQGLRTLSRLDLSRTLIHTFPDFILELPHLHSLSLSGCPLRDVPPEILGAALDENCLDAVRSHFADKTYGIALDREIKLILLGNGRVGKTSLVKRLVQNAFDPSEPSTDGIQLVHCHDKIFC